MHRLNIFLSRFGHSGWAGHFLLPFWAPNPNPRVHEQDNIIINLKKITICFFDYILLGNQLQIELNYWSTKTCQKVKTNTSTLLSW